MKIRLFLVAPEGIAEPQLLACAAAACEAADCATIVVAETVSIQTVEALQTLNLAVILQDCEVHLVQDLKADGLLLSHIENFKDARVALPREILGFLAGVSRHAAMEAAELGADFLCFTQSKQYAGEPIIGWWQDVTDIPSVAFDETQDGTLQSQHPDFIRPSDDMWSTADAATIIVKALTAQWPA
jgi:thiamine-phosphate pyrophosphorylase